METFGIDSRFGKALLAEVTVNGMLVVSVQPGHESFQSLPIHQDVLPGANRLEVILTVPVAPGAPLPLGDPMSMFVDIAVEADHVRDIGESYEVTTSLVREARWQADEGAPLTLPHRMAIDWVVPSSITPPIWTRAQRATPEQARMVIVSELQELRRLLEARQIDAFQNRMRLRNEDMARAYPITGSANRRADLDSAMLADLLPETPRFASIDPARLQIRPFADGLVLAVQMDDGKAPLRCGSPTNPIEIATTFAMIDGRMAVVR